MDITKQMERYQSYLQERGYAQRTVESYVWVAAHFERTYLHADAQPSVGTQPLVGTQLSTDTQPVPGTQPSSAGAHPAPSAHPAPGTQPLADALRAYQRHLVQTFKPATANQRVLALNCYLTYLGHSDLKLRCQRVQLHTFLAETMDDSVFRRLTTHLLGGEYLRDYHAVRIMATTGVRVSELLRMEVEHMRDGFIDLRSKGKVRRVHVPDATAAAALAWAQSEGRDQGALLLNRYGRPITKQGLSHQLKVRAAECDLDPAVVHPHAFRHLFARNFLAAGGDIALLADLLGHSSIETTRVYLRRTSGEQRAELNRLVSW